MSSISYQNLYKIVLFCNLLYVLYSYLHKKRLTWTQNTNNYNIILHLLNEQSLKQAKKIMLNKVRIIGLERKYSEIVLLVQHTTFLQTIALRALKAFKKQIAGMKQWKGKMYCETNCCIHLHETLNFRCARCIATTTFAK